MSRATPAPPAPHPLPAPLAPLHVKDATSQPDRRATGVWPGPLHPTKGEDLSGFEIHPKSNILIPPTHTHIHAQPPASPTHTPAMQPSEPNQSVPSSQVRPHAFCLCVRVCGVREGEASPLLHDLIRFEGGGSSPYAPCMHDAAPPTACPPFHKRRRALCVVWCARMVLCRAHTDPPPPPTHRIFPLTPPPVPQTLPQDAMHPSPAPSRATTSTTNPSPPAAENKGASPSRTSPFKQGLSPLKMPKPMKL